MREEVGQELADHEIGVGDGERPATAVAGGAGIGAGTLGPDAEALAVEADDRAAARRDRVDLHHRRTDAYPRHLGIKGALEGTGLSAEQAITPPSSWATSHSPIRSSQGQRSWSSSGSPRVIFSMLAWRVQVVGVLERHPQPTGQRRADRRLAGAGDTHHHDGVAR